MKKMTTFLVVLATVFGVIGQAHAVTVCPVGCNHTEIGAAANDEDFAGQDIVVGPGTYNEAGISFDNRALVSTNPDHPELTIIDGTGIAGNSFILRIANATVRGFTIRGGRVGIRDDSIAGTNRNVLQDLIVEDNGDDTSAGRGVEASYGSLEILNCSILNNSGTVGAGINLKSGLKTTIKGSTIQDNLLGGGISFDPGNSLFIENSVIAGNASVNGGGISAFGPLVLINVDILNNTATNNGGGIYKSSLDVADNDINITGGTIDGNEANRGGGIYLQSGRPQLSSSATITHNTALEGDAGSSGGGIRCRDANNVAILPDSVHDNTPGDITCIATDRPPDPERATSTAGHRFAATERDPINTFTGELFSRKPRGLDLGGPMPLYYQPYYASFLRRGFIVGDLGSNWRHNFDARLFRSGNTITYVSHDGRESEFLQDLETGGWNQLTNTDTPYQLSVVAGEDVKLYDPEDERIYSFDFTTSNVIIGKLVRIEDGHGNLHAVTYDLPTGQIQTVSDGLGRTLTFTYTSDPIPKISVVSDGTRSISFQYTDPIDTEYLTLASDARRGVTEYSYEDTSAVADHALMISMTLPRGNVPYSQTFFDTSNQFASGRVATQTDSNGHTFSFEYNRSRDTTLTGPRGNTRVHTHTATGEFSNRTDQAGLSFSLGSDATGRRNSITDRLGATTSYDYHPESGKLSSVTNADGTTTTYGHTARLFGDLTLYDNTSITYADDTSESLSYDDNGNPISHTDQAGNTSSATHNAYGQPLTTTNTAGGVTTNTYGADATLATSTDPAGNLTTFSYDASRRLSQLTFADGSARQFTYDAEDRLLSLIDETANTTAFSYDANGNLETMTDPLDHTTTFTYDGNDRLLSTTDSLSGVTGQTYDAFGRLETLTDANSNVTTLGYDLLERLTTVTFPDGNSNSFSYDAEGVLSSASDGLGNTTTFVTDQMGRVIRQSSPLGNVSQFGYDALGRVVSITDPLNQTTIFHRDSRGLLSGIDSPGGVGSTTYTRDSLGNIAELTDPGGNIWQSSFDQQGLRTSSTDPLGNTRSITHDKLNRPRVITFPGALGSLTLGYDPAGNLTSSTYSDGTSFKSTYDAKNRLTSANGINLAYDANDRITDSNGIAVGRDAGGRITQMTLATGKALSYTYDSSDRVTRITDWAGGMTTFSYDAAGRHIGMTRPNGIDATKTYDNDGRLTGLTEGSISTIALERDANGQTTSAARDVPRTASAANLTGTAASFDAAGQLESVTYDAMGRVTSDGARGFVWDLDSRLSSVTTSEGTTSFTYDALGYRLSRTASGMTRSYVWNYALDLTSASIEQQGGSDLRYYVHTPRGDLLYSLDAATNARNYYHYDEMGNTIFVTDDAGAVTGGYAHSPYGQLLASTGGLDQPFTWQGQYGIMDEGDGLYYVRARYYDAESRRFISRDPIDSIDPKEVNPYQYALGNPLKFVDVTGRQSVSKEEIDVEKAKADLAAARSAFRSADQARSDAQEDLEVLRSKHKAADSASDRRKYEIEIARVEKRLSKSRTDIDNARDAYGVAYNRVIDAEDTLSASENPVLDIIRTSLHLSEFYSPFDPVTQATQAAEKANREAERAATEAIVKHGIKLPESVLTQLQGFKR